MGRRNAFTIPEVLAIVAIISILIAMLMPALGQAKEHAKLIKCQSVMHQTAIANRTYSVDWQGWFIYNTYGGGSYRGVSYTKYWATDPEFVERVGLTTEEVSNKWRTNPGNYGAGFAAGCQWPQRFDCPNQGRPYYWIQDAYWGHEIGVAYNREHHGNARRAGTVVNPSSKFQFGDGDNWWMSSFGSNYQTFFDRGFIDHGGWGGLLPRHNISGSGDRANIAFYDAHVEAVPKERTYFYGSNAANLNRERWDLGY